MPRKDNGLAFSTKKDAKPLILLGWLRGLEPPALGTTSRCSNQLSYSHHILKKRVLVSKSLFRPLARSFQEQFVRFILSTHNYTLSGGN
jgi:hypothetical protein